MMKFKTRFVNFKTSPALETYAKKHMKPLINRLEGRKGKTKSIDVSFTMDAKAPFGIVKNNKVSIHYRYPGIKKIIRVQKKGKDLRKVLIKAIHATETVIRRLTEKSESGRRTIGKTKKYSKM